MTVGPVAKAALAGVIVAALAWPACTPGGSDAAATSGTTIAPVAPADEPVGPRSVDTLGAPHGWRQDQTGALAAAVSAVRLSGVIATAGFITRCDMIRSLTTERFGPELATLSAAQLEEMTVALGEASVSPAALLWQELPLTARARDDGARVEVQVWSVLVVAVPGVGAPRQAWRTVTIELVWEADDWKVDGWSTIPGPTPLLDQTAGIDDADAVAEVLSWPVAPAGGG